MGRVGTQPRRSWEVLPYLLLAAFVAALAGDVGHAEGTAMAPPSPVPDPPPVVRATDALDLLARAVTDPWDLDRALLQPVESTTSTSTEGTPPFHAFVEAGGTTHDAVVLPASAPSRDAVKLGGTDDLLSRGGVLCRIPQHKANGAPGDLSTALERAGAPLLDEPQPHAALGERLVVRGRAAGTWYAEAAFPVRLLAADGSELAAAPAVAEGSWMTASYVPFRAELHLAGTLPDRAMLVLERANPSGLARNAAFLLVRLGCG